MLSSDGSGHLHAWIVYQVIRLSYGLYSEENLPHGHHICKRLCFFFGSVLENIGQINWLGAVHLFVLRQSTANTHQPIQLTLTWWILMDVFDILLASMWRGCMEKEHVNAKCQNNTWSFFSAFLLMSIYFSILNVSKSWLFKRICNYRFTYIYICMRYIIHPGNSVNLCFGPMPAHVPTTCWNIQHLFLT